MMHIKKASVVLFCLIVGFGGLMTSTVADASKASIWTLDSSGNPLSFKNYDPGQDGWKAISYERYTSEWSYLFWTKDNLASLWTINPSGAVAGYKSYTPGSASPAWRGASYNWSSVTKEGRMLWTRDNAASIWTIDASGNPVAFKGYSPGSSASPAWQATSYELYSSGWAYLLWTRDNQASLWTIDPSGTAVGFKSYTPGSASPAWRATSFTWDPVTKYAEMVWTRDNSASLWTIDPSGNPVKFKNLTPGSSSPAWTAESIISPSGITAPAGAKTLSAKMVLVKKAGSGKGTITYSGQVCGVECVELGMAYVAGEKADVQVTPAEGSRFAGWEAADGTPLESIYYANPGDTVFAVFEQE